MATAPKSPTSIVPWFQKDEEVFESAPDSADNLAAIIARLREDLTQTKHENASLQDRMEALLLEHESQLTEEKSKAEHLAARVEALSAPKRETERSLFREFNLCESPKIDGAEFVRNAQQLVVVKGQLKMLEAEFEPVKSALRAAEAHHQSLLAEKVAAQQQSRELEGSLRALKTQVDKITTSADSVLEENSRLKAGASQLEARMEALQNVLQEKEGSISSLKVTLEETKRCLSDEKGKRERLEEENKVLKRSFYVKFKELLSQLFFAIFGFLLTGTRR